jgi:hypothetical protein
VATPLEGTVSRDFSECTLVLKTKSVLVEQASMLQKFKILLRFLYLFNNINFTAQGKNTLQFL